MSIFLRLRLQKEVFLQGLSENQTRVSEAHYLKARRLFSSRANPLFRFATSGDFVKQRFMKTLLLAADMFFSIMSLASESSVNSWDWLVGCYKTVAYNGTSYQAIEPSDQIITRIAQISSQRFFTASDRRALPAIKMEFGDKKNGTVVAEVVLGQNTEWTSPDVYDIKFNGATYDSVWENTVEHEIEARFSKKSETDMVIGYLDSTDGTSLYFRVVASKVDCPLN